MRPRLSSSSTTWSKHDKHTAMRLLGSAGIPAGAVLDTKELYEDKTFYKRGIMQECASRHQGLRHSGVARPAQRQAAGREGLAAARRAFGRGAPELAGSGRARDRGPGGRQDHHAAEIGARDEVIGSREGSLQPDPCNLPPDP